ncbi:MAG: hypothetical protein AABW92_05915 [Nanoarchaeota archaeon]
MSFITGIKFNNDLGMIISYEHPLHSYNESAEVGSARDIAYGAIGHKDTYEWATENIPAKGDLKQRLDTAMSYAKLSGDKHSVAVVDDEPMPFDTEASMMALGLEGKTLNLYSSSLTYQARKAIGGYETIGEFGASVDRALKGNMSGTIEAVKAIFDEAQRLYGVDFNPDNMKVVIYDRSETIFPAIKDLLLH